MSRTLILAALAATGLSALPAPAAPAACGGEVAFAPGTDHAAIKGRLAGTQTCDYTLRARKGQVLSAALDATDGVEVIVFDPVEHALVPGESLILPQDATYTVRVLQTSNAGRRNTGDRPFALSLRVAAAITAPATQPAPVSATLCEGGGALASGQANMSGRLSGDGMCSYGINVQAGQILNLLMDAPAGVEAMVRAPGAATADPLMPETPVRLSVSGEYTVIIGRTRNDARKEGARDFSAVVTVE